MGCAGTNGPDAGQPEALWSVARWKAEGRDAVLIGVCREADYARGHLPGAHRIWRTDIESRDYPYGGMAAPAEAVRALLDSIGLRSGQQVVVYDDVGGCDAARLWWLLRFYGHEQVALLDGGPNTWVQDGEALTTAVPVAGPATGFSFDGVRDLSLLASVEDVQHAAENGVLLLDTRTEDEHTGRRKKPGAARAGRIPNSLHYNWGNAVDLEGSGRIKSTADLAWDLRQAGLDFESPVITYCHTGVRSAHTTFVLREILGFPSASNYDGSWTEWSHLPALPAESDLPLNPAL